MSQVQGVVVGLITDTDDKKHEGRVKVHFPWLGDKHETDWIRIATLMSGKDRGSFFMPEIADEVLVAFEHGDTRFPYVIGFLWNGEDQPPSDNPSRRTLKSKTGHTIVLDDTPSGEKIKIESKSGHSVTLDDTAGGRTIALATKGGQKVTMDDNAKSITLKASGRTLTIGPAMVEIT